MIEPTLYLPTVAWRTQIRNVIKLSDYSYRVTVNPIDANEPGAYPLVMGDYLKDYIGHTYKITDYTAPNIDIIDEFKTGVGPQTSQQGLVYKSVFKGKSPYLAPIYYRHLDKSAMDYSRRWELDILWRNDPNAIKVEFTDTNQPALVDYQDNYAEDYGELPKLQLITYNGVGEEWIRQEVPVIYKVDGLIDSIVWDLSDNYSGYIIISK